MECSCGDPHPERVCSPSACPGAQGQRWRGGGPCHRAGGDSQPPSIRSQGDDTGRWEEASAQAKAWREPHHRGGVRRRAAGAAEALCGREAAGVRGVGPGGGQPGLPPREFGPHLVTGDGAPCGIRSPQLSWSRHSLSSWKEGTPIHGTDETNRARPRWCWRGTAVDPSGPLGMSPLHRHVCIPVGGKGPERTCLFLQRA